MKTRISIIVPTRERAAYLPHCLRTCTANPEADLEILVLDNASTDGTAEVMAQVSDKRVRYLRNAERLSMRDNFEKGLLESQGEIICFIGDDDGVLPHTVKRALEIFDTEPVEAVSAARAHYFWPDLLAGRRNTALVPRGTGLTVLDSARELRGVLRDAEYYRLPCLYHGFVKRELVQKVRDRQPRFFLSSQVDMFSAIALSMENVRYALSKAPLIVNGASRRSNGAAHFGGGAEREKQLWKKEDDIGFLPGFDTCLSVQGLIVESALRYGAARGVGLSEILYPKDVIAALQMETSLRRGAGMDPVLDQQMWNTAGFESAPAEAGDPSGGPARQSAPARFLGKFLRNCPVDIGKHGIDNVYESAMYLDRLLAAHKVGLTSRPVEQLATALRIARQ